MGRSSAPATLVSMQSLREVRCPLQAALSLAPLAAQSLKKRGPAAARWARSGTGALLPAPLAAVEGGTGDPVLSAAAARGEGLSAAATTVWLPQGSAMAPLAAGSGRAESLVEAQRAALAVAVAVVAVVVLAVAVVVLAVAVLAAPQAVEAPLAAPQGSSTAPLAAAAGPAALAPLTQLAMAPHSLCWREVQPLLLAIAARPYMAPRGPGVEALAAAGGCWLLLGHTLRGQTLSGVRSAWGC